MKVAIVFLLALALVNASLPANLVRRSQPTLNQALAKTRLQLTANVRSSMHRDLDVDQFITGLQQQAEQLLVMIQEALANGQAMVLDYIQQLQPIIAHLQQNGAQIVQGIIAQLQQIINQIFGNSKSGHRNWLQDMVINAVFGSSSFQNLLNSDAVVQCLRNAGHNVNSDFIMDIIESSGALHFVTVTAASCITENGGIELVVQTSPVIQFAWNTAKTFSFFGVMKMVKDGIRKHLGNELGNTVINALENNPHARSISDLIGQIGNLNFENIAQIIQSNFAPLIDYVQNYIQEYIAVIIAQGQAALAHLQAAVGPFMEQLQTMMPVIYEQLQALFGQLAY